MQDLPYIVCLDNIFPAKALMRMINFKFEDSCVPVGFDNDVMHCGLFLKIAIRSLVLSKILCVATRPLWFSAQENSEGSREIASQ